MGASQEKATTVELVKASFLVRLVGGPGTVGFKTTRKTIRRVPTIKSKAVVVTAVIILHFLGNQRTDVL